MMELHSHSVSQITLCVQYAGIAALQGDQTCVADMVREFRIRRDLLRLSYATSQERIREVLDRMEKVLA